MIFSLKLHRGPEICPWLAESGPRGRMLPTPGLDRLWDKNDYGVIQTLDRVICTSCEETGLTVRSCPQLKRNISGCNSEYKTLFELLCDQ